MVSLHPLRALAVRIAGIAPDDQARRGSCLGELEGLREELGERLAGDALDRLDAAILLMRFMQRAPEGVTEEGLLVLASLISSIGGAEEEEGAKLKLEGEGHKPPPRAPNADLKIAFHVLLGELLLGQGLITGDQIEAALRQQQRTKQPLGRCLVQMGAASDGQVARALERQRRFGGEEESAFERTVMDGMLGEVMVRMGMIGRERIDEALMIQRATGMRFGEAMIEAGAITWDQLDSALTQQQQLV